MRRTTIWRTVHPTSKDKGMFLSRFRRRKSVVDRIEAYTRPECTPWVDRDRIEHTINVSLPLTVDAALAAQNFERQLKRHGRLS